MKLTPEVIDDLIAEASYLYVGTLTICVLTLTNGAVVTGQSNVIDPANYDRGLGENAAYTNARNKIWELEGYAIKTRKWVTKERPGPDLQNSILR